MSPPRPPEEGDRHDDANDARLHAWIDALQGREPPSQPPASDLTAPKMPVGSVTASSRAGTLLRQLVLRAQQARQAQDAAYTQALLDRWHTMGLLAPRPARSLAARWALAARHGLATPARRVGVSTLALASVLMGVWVTRGPQVDGHKAPGQDGDAGVMRGADAVPQVTAADPAALAQRVLAALQSHQIAARRVDLPSGSVQLQARIPADAAAARQDLAALGIPVPAHGRLDVVIARPR